MCRDTDRELARSVGGVLAAAGVGSEDIVDAHVVATAAESGRAVAVPATSNGWRRYTCTYRRR
jgi:hypothetical protein